MRLGIVTCGKCRDLIPDERALLPLLTQRGIQGIPVVWNDALVDWKTFDALLVRSVWDYHLHPAEFNDWLLQIESAGIPCWNSIDTIRWNHHKFYLHDLQHRGVDIVPTLFMRNAGDAASQLRELGWRKVVIKPAVSASGYRTQSTSLESPQATSLLLEASAFGDFLVQPFMPEISQSGEVSLIFFNHRFSHAVLKRPRDGEFRVQVEHGGHQVPYHPNERLIQQARNAIDNCGFELLYARVDGIIKDGKFLLMELELIEPDLFLSTRNGAGHTFVTALTERLTPVA